MNHGSLFSGIGGFDLAAEWMGWDNKFHCEVDLFCQKVLDYYWPKAKMYEDIRTTDFHVWRGRVDILTGGFPCQPYSTAGERKGTEDDRHLWPEMLRAIEEIKPRWVVGENVRGLISWSDGLVFEQVQVDLEAKGYEVWTSLLPACAIDAPHRRDRLWFVAYSGDSQCKGRDEFTEGQQYDGGGDSWGESSSFGGSPDVTDSSLQQLQGGKQYGGIGSEGEVKGEGGYAGRSFRSKWQEFPTQSPICTGNDGFSERLDGITFSKWRNESIKGAGNAVVPQLVYEIFKTIEDFEKSV